MEKEVEGTERGGGGKGVRKGAGKGMGRRGIKGRRGWKWMGEGKRAQMEKGGKGVTGEGEKELVRM